MKIIYDLSEHPGESRIRKNQDNNNINKFTINS